MKFRVIVTYLIDAVDERDAIDTIEKWQKAYPIESMKAEPISETPREETHKGAYERTIDGR